MTHLNSLSQGSCLWDIPRVVASCIEIFCRENDVCCSIFLIQDEQTQLMVIFLWCNSRCPGTRSIAVLYFGTVSDDCRRITCERDNHRKEKKIVQYQVKFPRSEKRISALQGEWPFSNLFTSISRCRPLLSKTTWWWLSCKAKTLPGLLTHLL